MTNKIVFLSLHPGFGGAASANANIIKMLSTNHEVIFIDEYIESTSNYLTPDYKNISTIYYPIDTNRYCPWKILKILKKLEPDTILVGVQFLLIFYWPILLYFRLKKCNIITILHSLTLGDSAKSKIIDLLLSFSLLVCNRLIFVSKFTQHSWNKFPWVRRVHSQYIRYNTIERPMRIHHKNLIETIGFIGRLSDEKQPELFCQLAEKSKAEGLPYRFIVWGDGALRDKLANKYSNFLEFKGTTRDIEEIYSGVDILVMTSVVENCPMVLIESKARGIPAICPNIGGIPEILTNGEDGLLLDELNLRNLLEAINVVSRNYAAFMAKCFENSDSFINTNHEGWEY